MRALGDKIEAQAAGRAGRRAGRAVERRGGRDRRGGAQGRRGPRLPAHDQGRGGRRRARHAPRRQGEELDSAFERARAEAASAFGDPTRADGAPGRRRAPRRGPAARRRPGRACGRSASATAPTSAATRRWSRSPPARCSRRAGDASSRSRRGGSRCEAGYRGAGTVEFLYEPDSEQVLRSWRSTRASRSSTPSPRPSPAPTSSAAAARRRGRHARGRPAAAARPRHRGPPQRRGPRPRLLAFTGPHLAAAPAAGPGIRVDTGVAEGDTVPAEFDSMIAKIIAHGDTREQAIARLRRARRRHDGRIEEGHHQPGLPARAARPPRAARRRGRHRLARPPAGYAARCSRSATPTPRSSRPRSRSATRPPPTSARASTRSRAAAARTPTPTSAARSTCSTSGASYRFQVCQIGAAALPRRGRRPAHRGDRRAADRAREPPRPTAATRYRTVTALQDADLLVEVNGVPHRVSRDEGGLSAATARASWSRSRSPRATRSRPATSSRSPSR